MDGITFLVDVFNTLQNSVLMRYWYLNLSAGQYLVYITHE